MSTYICTHVLHILQIHICKVLLSLQEVCTCASTLMAHSTIMNIIMQAHIVQLMTSQVCNCIVSFQ